MSAPEPKAVVELVASDLLGPGVVFCPNPRMPLWSNHPRVFIGVHVG
ncbi:MAG TPA: zinc-finger domain-containing protein, partial [Rubrivivax sp.]|nr:zinc-finger domain-containing protein [Rubrivivax sp.]